MPKLSITTLTTGANALVVQFASLEGNPHQRTSDATKPMNCYVSHNVSTLYLCDSIGHYGSPDTALIFLEVVLE
jgi:hypothetical protein